MAATHHLFNYVTATSASTTIPATASDHFNMLGLRDFVFISPQHHQPQPILPSSAAVGVGVSIFPLLAANPCVEIATTADPHAASSNLAAAKDNIPIGIEIERLEDGGSGSGNGNPNGGIGGSSGTTACRDCGNRAKKECSFRRCRTCCKSRGYDCATHVKSTWVPAARRRERQVAMVGISFAGGGGGGSSGSSTGGAAAAKKQRVENASSTSISATPRSFDSSPFRQDASFKQSLPGQVRAPAVFRCIRVTAIGDNAAEIVYQATVTISGHVFKGFLYDHGRTHAKNSSSSIACVSELRIDQGNTGHHRQPSPPPPHPPPVVNASDAFGASGRQRLLGGED